MTAYTPVLVPRDATALTERQAQVLRYIGRYIADNETPPTASEIALALGASAKTKNTRPFTRPLVEKGYISITPKIARGIRLTEKGKAWLAERRREEEPLLG